MSAQLAFELDECGDLEPIGIRVGVCLLEQVARAGFEVAVSGRDSEFGPQAFAGGVTVYASGRNAPPFSQSGETLADATARLIERLHAFGLL